MKEAMCITTCVVALLVFGYMMFICAHNASLGDNPAAYVTTYSDLFSVMYVGLAIVVSGGVLGWLISL
nr:MAG TPA: hypothetical protein [Caudoviricetes sp.]